MKIHRKKYAITPLTYRSPDPFANMIVKANKSPLLKPVCVKSRTHRLTRMSSEAKISPHYTLPPISPIYRSMINIEIPSIERLYANSPILKISHNKNRVVKNFSEMKYHDVSFGEPQNLPKVVKNNN